MTSVTGHCIADALCASLKSVLFEKAAVRFGWRRPMMPLGAMSFVVARVARPNIARRRIWTCQIARVGGCRGPLHGTVGHAAQRHFRTWANHWASRGQAENAVSLRFAQAMPTLSGKARPDRRLRGQCDRRLRYGRSEQGIHFGGQP
jgi:hypothetical protein